MTTKDIGDFGEKIAKNHLQKNGYKILETNFHTRYGEIDIIAKKDEYLVIIEVKTRQNRNFYNPCECVDKRKQEKIIKSLMCYLDNLDTAIRFDVIEVIYKMNMGEFIVLEVNHIENAFWEE